MAHLGFRMRGPLFLLGLAVWPWASAQAAPTLDTGQKFALVIGISDYADERFKDLRYADSDAEALHAVLTDPARGGFAPQNTRLLTSNGATPPTKNNVFRELQWLRANAGPNDLVLVFFAGHGFRDEFGTYLVPRDGEWDVLVSSGINMEDFNRFVNAMNARRKIVVFDCCHAGGVSDMARGNEPLDAEYYHQAHAQAEGRINLSACRAGELSFEYDTAGHGVFTYYLCEALRGGADRDLNGVVTFSEVETYVKSEVVRWASEHGQKQNPQVDAIAVSGEFVLADNPDAAGSPKIAEAAGKIRGLVDRGILTGEEGAAIVEALYARTRSDTKEGATTVAMSPTTRAAILALGEPVIEAALADSLANPVEVPTDDPPVSVPAASEGGTYSGPAPGLYMRTGQQWVGARDGVPMANFKPGRYAFGLTADAAQALQSLLASCDLGALGANTVPGERELPGFLIDVHEVTMGQYAEFLAQTSHAPPATWPSGGPTEEQTRLPVTGVTHEDAAAYAKWAGKRLPTADEWEAAARGGRSDAFPWVGGWSDRACNSAKAGIGAPARVGTFAKDAAPIGRIVDMAGNVAEWTATEAAGGKRVVCGGSFADDPPFCAAFVRRAYEPGTASPSIGFRCVTDPVPF